MPRIFKRQSVIWTYFTREHETSAICNLCSHKLSYKSSASNLKRHLIAKHKELNFRFETTTNRRIQIISSDTIVPDNQIQWTLVEADANSPMVTAVPSETETAFVVDTSQEGKICKIQQSASLVDNSLNINKILLLLFIRDFQPLSIVKNNGFNAFLQALNPSYNIPDFESLSTLIMPALYGKCLQDVKFIVANEVESLCLTIDIWNTLDASTYMELAIHYINKNFEYRTVLLDCTPLSQFLSSDHLANKLNYIMDSWGLSDKVLISISNRDKKICDAVKKLEWEHFVCYADTINSIVAEALSNSLITLLLQRITEFINYLNDSKTAKEAIAKHQLNEGIDTPKVLIRGGSTKWYLVYCMLQRLVQLKEEVQNSRQYLDEAAPELSSEDWKACEDLCLVLKPFYEACEKMNEEGYLNASLVIVMTRGLTVVCRKLQEKPNLTTLAKAVVTKLSVSLNKNFSNIEFDQSLALCTFLDPRFKHHVFTNSVASENVKRNCMQLLSELIKEEMLEMENESLNADTNGESFSIWEDVDTVISKVLPQNTPTNKAATEIQRYMKDKILERGQPETPLEWWHKYSRFYPYLSTLFRQKCCSVATSISCDRLYSKSKWLLASRRKYLSENELKYFVFLNVNYDFSESVKECIF